LRANAGHHPHVDSWKAEGPAALDPVASVLGSHDVQRQLAQAFFIVVMSVLMEGGHRPPPTAWRVTRGTEVL